MNKQIPFSAVLLAGGIGSRMGNPIPKQYLFLKNKPIVRYSFEVLLTMPGIEQIVVVCDPIYNQIFQTTSSIPISFALPGKRRQDSLFNAIQQLNKETLVCIHDGARPLINSALIDQVLMAAQKWGAAGLGVRVQGTIKKVDLSQFISETIDRSSLWEMQTPQVVLLSLLKKGFSQVNQKNLTVTDDVSLVEWLQHPIKVVEGSYTNIKITTPDDLLLAEYLWDRQCIPTK
jgi:2-C-methyl-D-erythritol 4-phosphate cytidylyltransferase